MLRIFHLRVVGFKVLIFLCLIDGECLSSVHLNTASFPVAVALFPFSLKNVSPLGQGTIFSYFLCELFVEM